MRACARCSLDGSYSAPFGNASRLDRLLVEQVSDAMSPPRNQGRQSLWVHSGTGCGARYLKAAASDCLDPSWAQRPTVT